MRKRYAEEPGERVLPVIVLIVMATCWMCLGQFASDIVYLESIRLGNLFHLPNHQVASVIRFSHFLQGATPAAVAAVVVSRERFIGLVTAAAALILCLLVQKWFRGLVVRPGTFES